MNPDPEQSKPSDAGVVTLTPKLLGRPSGYTEDLASAICGEIACGRSLRDICDDESMPAERTVFRWLSVHPDFQRLYGIARASACDALAAEIIEIADDTSSDWIEEPGKNGGTVRRADNAVVQRARLQIDSRKWLLSKLRPEKYGDSVALTGAQGAPLIPPPRPVSVTAIAETAITLLSRARASIEAPAIEAEAAPENEAAIRLLERHGVAPE